MSLLGDGMSAVAMALNAEAFSVAFSARPAYRPRSEVRDLTSPIVWVVPGAIARERISRGVLTSDFSLHVVVQGRLSGDDDEELDPYLRLLEEIEAFLAGRVFDGRFVCRNTVREQPFAVEHVDQMAVFTSIVSINLTDKQAA